MIYNFSLDNSPKHNSNIPILTNAMKNSPILAIRNTLYFILAILFIQFLLSIIFYIYIIYNSNSLFIFLKKLCTNQQGI